MLLVSALKVCVCVLQNVQLETIISLGGRSRSGREGRRRRGFRFPSAGCRAGVVRQWFCLLAAMTWLQQSKGVQSVAPPHSREQPRPTLRAPPPAVNPPPRSESRPACLLLPSPGELAAPCSRPLLYEYRSGFASSPL